MNNISPKRSAIDWLNRVEYRLRQFRSDASSSDVLVYSESIATVKRILRTFRKHHSRRANKQQYAKPVESSFRARTVRYERPNVVERQHP
jgi:hypothetical protein